MAIVYSISNTSVSDPRGLIIRLQGGEAWDADDPLVQMYPNLFSDTPLKKRTSVDGWVENVETATKKPGEKRKTKRG